eukprot:scaffold32072_cov61-Phaeocystis_antarctica.AAC.7
MRTDGHEAASLAASGSPKLGVLLSLRLRHDRAIFLALGLTKGALQRPRVSQDAVAVTEGQSTRAATSSTQRGSSAHSASTGT